MFDSIQNTIVKQALTALSSHNKEAFEELLAPNVTFIHNGEPDDIYEWGAQFFFKNATTRFVGLTGTNDNDTIVYARLQFDQIKQVEVKLQFTITNGRIAELNAGRP